LIVKSLSNQPVQHVTPIVWWSSLYIW